MKKSLFVICYLLFHFSFVAAQGYELQISNYSTRILNDVPSPRTIIVKIYPASMIFNGENNYNLLAQYKNLSDIWQYYYNTGVAYQIIDPLRPELNIKRYYYTLNFSEHLSINADGDESGNNCKLGVGLGVYRVDVWWDNNFETQSPNSTFTIEYDANYRQPYGNLSADLSINFKDNYR